MQFQDGETRVINGVQYVRRGGQWIPQGGARPPSVIEGPPRPADVPSGYQQTPGGLTPIPGGPADPSRPESREPPTGYRYTPDGNLEPIPGGPANRGNPLREGESDRYRTLVGDYTQLETALNTYQDDFSGVGSGVENAAQAVLGTGTPGQRDWWAAFRMFDNEARGRLFGASLTANEQRAWDATTITPNMTPTEIRRNLSRRRELVGAAINRDRSFLIANGSNPEAVDALTPRTLLNPSQSRGIDGLGRNAGIDNQTSVVMGGQDNGAMDEQVRRYAAGLMQAGARPEEIRRNVSSIFNGYTIPANDPGMQYYQQTGEVPPVIMNGGDQSGTTVSSEDGGLAQSIGAGGLSYLNGATLGAFQNQGMEQVREQNSLAAFTGDTLGLMTAGGVLSAGGRMAAGRLAPQLLGGGRLGAYGRTAAEGSAIGGVYGGNTTGDPLGGAAMGAVGGAVGRGIADGGMAVGRAATAPFRGIRNAIKPQQGGGRAIVVDALRQDGVTPMGAVEQLAQRQELGVPAIMGDLGDNTRALTGALGRRPETRTMIREPVIERQMGQNDRILNGIESDLGPIQNPYQVSDDLISQARTRAGPLYEQAYAQRAVDSPEITSLLSTPIGRQALNRARTIAANERRDPTTLGIDLDQQGEAVLTRVPSMETLDFVKRGMDDVIEQFRDPVTRRLNLDEAGRAMNQARSQFVSELDRLNPTYAEARAAYAGPASARDAMEMGRRATTASANDVQRMTGGMSPEQMAQFQVGHRASLAEGLGRRVDGGNSVTNITGTPRRREALEAIYGGNPNLSRFTQRMDAENQANQTYSVVNTGSPTAQRQIDDAALAVNSSPADDAITGLLGGAKQGGFGGLMAAGVEGLRNASRYGIGRQGEMTRREAAQILSSNMPDVSEFLRAQMREEARRRLAASASQRRKNGLLDWTGYGGTGAGLGLLGF